MPRKKRTIIDENIPDETPTDNHEKLDDLVIVSSKVYKIANAKRSFCFQSIEPVDEIIIQDRYPMGGSFVVFEYNQADEVVNSQTFDIEAKPSLSNPAGQSQTTDTQSLLMSELNWMRGMFMNMIANRSNESTPMTEIVRAVKDMHSMAGGSLKDPVELLIKGMELGQKSSSSASGDWKSELIHTVKETAGPILNALSAPKPQIQNGVTPPMLQDSNTLPPLAIVKQAIVWLKGKILYGLTPDLAVDWILQNGNDPQYQPILSMAVQGTVENFIEQDAEIANEPYRTWFTSAIQMIKDAYAEQNGNVVNMDGGVGNVADHAVDAKSGSGKSKIRKVV